MLKRTYYRIEEIQDKDLLCAHSIYYSPTLFKKLSTNRWYNLKYDYILDSSKLMNIYVSIREV